MKLSGYIGETSFYDKKLMLERDNPVSWLKSVSAFSNTLGGKLLFGVSDEGELVGLANAEKDAEDISEVIKTQIDPIPQTKLSIHEEGGKRFVVVEVFVGDETPYYIRHKGCLTAYVRIGNESVRADSTQLNRLVLKGSHRTWDSLASAYRRKDFSFEVLNATYHEKTKLSFDESDFESFGLVTDAGRLTNAGALFADKSPIRQSRVFCTRWNGLTKTDGTMEADDDDEFSGGLVKLMDEAIDFVRVNSKKKWRKTLKGRVEYPDYPPDAVHEGVVNALIHRDYLETGSEVHIDIFDDRLEIYSPGGMVSGLLVQNVSLSKVGSKRRNPVIADLFQRMRLMERRGSGFGKIIDAYKAASESIGREVMPTFSSDAADFFLTLPNLNYGHSATSGTLKSSAKSSAKSSGKSSAKSSAKSSGKRANAKSEKSARIILRAIKSDANVSVRELQLRAHLSNSGVRKIIAALKAAGTVRRVGGTNGGHWEVVDS